MNFLRLFARAPILWGILPVFLLAAAGCSPVVETAPPVPSAALPAASLTPSAAARLPTAAGALLPTTLPEPTATLPVVTPTLSTPSETPFPGLTNEGLPPGEGAFLLPLTIRHLTEERAVLFFELQEPAGGYLLYQQIQPEVGNTRAIPLASGETRHLLTLEGLTPGSEYLALVGLVEAGGGLRQPLFQGEGWGEVRIRTLSGEGPLRVGVFGDASFGDPATGALVQEMAGRALDFVIHTGDVVAEIHENSGPPEAYALKYYQTLSALLHRMPVYTVIGNHDYDAAARWQDSVFYYYAFPPFPDPLFGDPPQPGKNQYYAFAAGGVQFLMLDTQVIFGQEGRQAQQDWLAERLADPRFRASIPVFHVPPFFSGSVHPGDQLPVRQSWHPLFVSAAAPLALSGHSHHYERLSVDGITYIVTGGGSSILYAPGEMQAQSQLFARRTHFVLLEIHPDRIELSAIDREGELFDQVAVPLP